MDKKYKYYLIVTWKTGRAKIVTRRHMKLVGHTFLTDFAKYLIEYLETSYQRRKIKESERFIVFTDGGK